MPIALWIMGIKLKEWIKMGKCIDSGKAGCPCALSTAEKCIICSRLNGGTCNDCNWSGVCIYMLFRQEGGKPLSRKERKMKICDITTYNETFKVFTVQADKGMCQKAQEAGAYMFLRRTNDTNWYDTPVSVLKSEPENGIIHFGISETGPKSKRLLDEKNEFIVRGVYYNGISNIDKLRSDVKMNIVYGKGIAIAPFRNILDMKERYGAGITDVTLIYDDAKCGMDFFRDYFGDMCVAKIKICDFSEEKFLIGSNERKNIFAFTSPYYTNIIEQKYNQDIVKPTEGNFCCGEGVCGACTVNNTEGNTIHRCKYRL